MDKLAEAIKKTKVPAALERRLFKRTRAILRKDRSRIKAGTLTEKEARAKAEIAAIQELIEETDKDLGTL